MSNKRKQDGDVEQNKSKKVKTFEKEELEYYFDLKNWKLSQIVENTAYENAFPDKQERLEFMKLQLDLLNAKIVEFTNIEKGLPKNKKHPQFFKAVKFTDNILDGPKKGTVMSIQNLERNISKLSNEIIEENEENE
jgi:hypothetical protein